MKKTNNRHFAAALALTSIIFASCQQLQDSLGSEMRTKLEEETGVAVLAEKAWYYNGTAGEDMSGQAIGQTILLDFGKKAALGTLTGSIELTYTNSSGNTVTETFNSISGTFTEDCCGYRINLGPVMAFFNQETIPGGKALITLKAGGFKCAEGKQSGRPIPSFEAKNIQIKPLYNSYCIDYSTRGFSSASRIELCLNGKVSLKNGSYTVTGTGSDSKSYSFTVDADGSRLVLKPSFTQAPGDGVTVPLTIKDIVPVTSGHSFEKEIEIAFSSHAIVIDGRQDDNYSAKDAVVWEDGEGDQKAFAGLGYDTSSECDLKKIFVTSDDEYIYIGVAGNLKLTWNNGLTVLISNGKVTGGDGAVTQVHCAGEEDFATKTGSRTVVRPNVYVFHQPGYGNSGTGKLSANAYVSGTNSTISGAVKCSPEGWTDSTTGEFIEYAIPLGAVTGLNKGDDLKIIVAAALHWDDGNAVVDAAPDSAAVMKNENNTSVQFNFENGISYKVPEN